MNCEQNHKTPIAQSAHKIDKYCSKIFIMSSILMYSEQYFLIFVLVQVIK